MSEKKACVPEGTHTYLECEKLWIFALLTAVGGYLGAFTYTIRGGVFSNAQTGNLVLLGIALGDGNWSKVLYLLIPISAYFLGAIISEVIAVPIKKLRLIRWDTLFIILEIIVVIILGLIPQAAPYQITQTIVNFICSMQSNTFRHAQGIPMATIFCPNHLSPLSISLVKTVTHR